VRAGGDGHGGGAQRGCGGVQPKCAVSVLEGHSGSATCGAQQAVLQRGAERGQELHVQPAQDVVVPRPDGGQRIAAAQEVRPH